MDGCMVPKGKKHHGLSLVLGNDDPRNVCESLALKEINHNTMDIMATLRALELSMDEKDVTIFTDSQFVSSSLNETFEKRQKNGWKKGDGVPHAHYELISQFRGIIEKRAIYPISIMTHLLCSCTSSSLQVYSLGDSPALVPALELSPWRERETQEMLSLSIMSSR